MLLRQAGALRLVPVHQFERHEELYWLRCVTTHVYYVFLLHWAKIWTSSSWLQVWHQTIWPLFCVLTKFVCECCMLAHFFCSKIITISSFVGFSDWSLLSQLSSNGLMINKWAEADSCTQHLCHSSKYRSWYFWHFIEPWIFRMMGHGQGLSGLLLAQCFWWLSGLRLQSWPRRSMKLSVFYECVSPNRGREDWVCNVFCIYSFVNHVLIAPAYRYC